MPTHPEDDSTTAEFKSLVESADLPWGTAPSDFQAQMPWNLMATGAASIIEEHVPKTYESVAGEFRCRCACGLGGIEIETPRAWAFHVAKLLFSPRI